MFGVYEIGKKWKGYLRNKPEENKWNYLVKSN